MAVARSCVRISQIRFGQNEMLNEKSERDTLCVNWMPSEKEQIDQYVACEVL